MSKETYSIPKGPTDQFNFQRNGIQLCTDNAFAWGIPNEVITAIGLPQSDYVQKYGVANNKNTRSVSATVARNASWQMLEVPLVILYDTYLVNNANISMADKVALNLTIRSGKAGAMISAAITTPIVVLMSEEMSVLHPVFTDSASSSGSHAKPNGVAFCEIWAKIDGEAPLAPADCPERFNISRSHQSIVFDTAQRSKTIYGFARWVNKNGKVGVWSNVFSAIIP